MTKYHFQSELDNLDNETIKAVEDYTQDNFTDDYLYKKDDEYRILSHDDDKLEFLEDLVIDLNLVEFKLTDIQEIIIAYMFINDLFSKEYTDEVMQLLDKVLL